MFNIDDMNFFPDSQVDSGVDIINYFLVVFCNVVLNVDYYQCFIRNFTITLKKLSCIVIQYSKITTKKQGKKQLSSLAFLTL